MRDCWSTVRRANLLLELEKYYKGISSACRNGGELVDIYLGLLRGSYVENRIFYNEFMRTFDRAPFKNLSEEILPQSFGPLEGSDIE